MPALTTVVPGALIARRYRVHGELGRGGMGIVYLCVDEASGEKVALKRLFRADAQLEPEDIWWFQMEARAVAALDHPAIVRGRDFGILADGSPYLVMDMATGRSLLGWLEIAAIPWPWPWTVLWSFTDQILAGLAHAHARGVIHGDLKPTNLMIDFPGPSSLPKVQILDLGLASLVRDPIDHRLDGAERSEARLVRAGAGTPGWMAPEQIRRATPHYGPPTDLYALGSILFHLLSGREPYVGTLDEVLEGHRNVPLPDLKLPRNAPEGTGTFVRTLLAKRPWQRFEYAGEARRVWAGLRPKEATEAWAFRVDPKKASERSTKAAASVPGKAPSAAERASAADLPDAPGTASGLLGLRASPLVAREEERAELRDVVRSACAEGSVPQQLVLLAGEAGVGKSRLAEWLCESVHERAEMVPLRARYRKIPAPLDGVVGAVNAHFGLEHADRDLVEQTLLNVWEIGKDDDEGRTWVAATAEWLRPTAPGTSPPAGPSGKRVFFDTPEMRTRVILRVLKKIGQKRPILLWLDDLHLASSRTFETLARLHVEGGDLRIVLMITARAEGVVADPAASSRLEALRQLYGGRVIELRALSDGDTEQLLLSSLPLDAAAVLTATRRSKGNPLFALQLLHAWAGQNRLELSDGRWRVPEEALGARAGNTDELWEERLAALPLELRGAALAAATLGGDIPTVVLRSLLASLSLPVSDAIGEMRRAEILVPSGPGRLRWTHALLQEHLLNRLREHADAKRIFRLASDAQAHHPAAGTRRVVSHRVTNLLRAGDEAAVARLVLEFVESSWKRVRDVGATLNDLSRLEGLVSGPTTAAYARWRAECLRHMGHFPQARELAEQARAAFTAMGDARNEAHCLRLIGHVCSEQSVAEGRTYVAAALAKFEALGDEGGRAECEVVIGEIDYLLGHHDSARALLTSAARRCAVVGDVLGRGQCLILLSLLEQALSHRAEARQMLEEARVEFESLGYRLGIAQCEVALAHVEHRYGDLDEALARAKDAKERFHELGNPRGEGACERLMAMASFDAGEQERARGHALASAAIFDQLGDPWGQVESALLLAQVALATGNPVARELVVACETVGLREAEPAQHLALTQAWLAHVEKRFADAVPAIERARAVFGTAKRTGDHTPHLLARIAGFDWPEPARTVIDEWWRELGGF